MELSKQVCSLESAKKLKELRINNPSLWLHIYPNEGMINSRANIVFHTQESFYLEDNDNDEHDLFSAHAYTSSELGGMLPSNLRHPKYDCCLLNTCKDAAQTWHTSYPIYIETGEEKDGLWSAVCGNWVAEKADTEAEARAKMLIYLLENKLITVQELDLEDK